jgi:hypothetical protein
MYADFFSWRKSRPAMLRGASGAPSKKLSSRAWCVVHEFYDMVEMPNSQGFLGFVGIAARCPHDVGRDVDAARSRRCGEPCCDAQGARRYTFP